MKLRIPMLATRLASSSLRSFLYAYTGYRHQIQLCVQCMSAVAQELDVLAGRLQAAEAELKDAAEKAKLGLGRPDKVSC